MKLCHLFRYFCDRDILLEASRVLGVETNNDNTFVESDNEDMEMESIMHDNMNGDTWSKSEVLFLKFRADNWKEVYALFNQFKTDGVDMTKLDQLLMQKSKNFYMLVKKKGCNVNVAGLLFTEKEAVSGWIKRSVRDMKLKLPTFH